MIRLIHMSDFHLRNERDAANKGLIVQALRKDLKSNENDNTLFIMTGDLIDKGGHNFKDRKNGAPFKEVKTLLFDPIVNAFPILNDRVYFVPGNHDCERDKTDSVSEA